MDNNITAGCLEFHAGMQKLPEGIEILIGYKQNAHILIL